jgi:hypothetical protein
MEQDKSDKSATGMAGEFFVMAQLYLRGFNAVLSYGNAKNLDVFVKTDSELYILEVKTTTEDTMHVSGHKWFGYNFEWSMNEKHETISDKRVIYCFVLLQSDKAKMPRFFLVRSEEVAKYIRDEQEYCKTFHADKPENDGKRRNFRIAKDENPMG